MMVAAAVPSPGIPKRIEVRSPVVPVMACMPRRKAKAEIGSPDLVGEGEHQRQGGQATEAGENPHDESHQCAQEQKAEGRPGEDVKQSLYEGVEHHGLSATSPRSPLTPSTTSLGWLTTLLATFCSSSPLSSL